MKNKFIVGIVVAVLVIGGIWYFTSNNQKAPETTKVRIADLPIVHGLPLYVAMEKGYFKDAGLEVERVKFEAPNQIIDAIMNRQVDFTSPGGALGITGIADYKNPGKLKIYGVSGETGNNSGENLILPIDSKITSIGELRGKKLGILAGTIQWRTIAREILAKNGLDIDKDLTVVELAGAIQVQALSAGQVDALLALEPISTIAISKGVAKLFVKAPAKQFIADPFWYGAGVVNEQFARNNPNTTKKVIEVFDKAMEEIEHNFDAYRPYLVNYTPLTNELISQVPPVNFKACDSLTDQDINSIKAFYGIFTKHKVVSGEINVNALLYCK